MKSYGFINAEKLPEISMKLQGSEIKMLLLILSYLSANSKQFLINNEEWRNFMASMEFDVTPERTSALLSSLTKKGILKREVKGVYSVIGDLYLPAEQIEVDPKILDKIKDYK